MRGCARSNRLELGGRSTRRRIHYQQLFAPERRCGGARTNDGGRKQRRSVGMAHDDRMEDRAG